MRPFLQLQRALEESFGSALTPAWAPIHPAADALVLLRNRYWASQFLQTWILFPFSFLEEGLLDSGIWAKGREGCGREACVHGSAYTNGGFQSARLEWKPGIVSRGRRENPLMQGLRYLFCKVD